MNLLITGAWRYTAEQLNIIHALGYQIYEIPNEKDQLPCEYEDVDAVICNGLFLYHPIEKFTSLKYIQLTSAGLDRVPLDYIKTHNIQLFSASGVYSIPMAEFAVSSALYFYKQIPFFVSNQNDNQWQKNRDLRELFGKTVCIVGCGSVGSECAKRFSAFGCKVIGVDKVRAVCDMFSEIYTTDRLYEAVGKADIVILSVALTEETYHLFDEKAFACMKPGSILINVARGAIIDSTALTTCLKQKKIFAALDVFEMEPIPADDPIWQMKNVYITPHNSFVGDGNSQRLWNVIYSNLEKNK